MLRSFGGIVIGAIRVCVYHPAAPRCAIESAAQQVRNWLAECGLLDISVVYTTARARKPAPLMLRSVGATSYYGDDDCDEQAALAAGIEFHRVERFL
jgi:hypothetical protein